MPPHDDREEVRSRVDLVSLVGSKVALKRSGRRWTGLCPFHDDKRPSLHVNAELGRYKCWACGAQGDCFTWMMETQRVDFRAALEQLAAEVGVTLSGTTEPGQRAATDGVMAEALAYFREELARSSLATENLTTRGVTAEAIRRWEIGYAPDVWTGLAERLRGAGHDLALCQELGLIDHHADGRHFDKFRGRIIFPIRNEQGRLVAFGGRILGNGHPKYINSAESPIFKKSSVLYGMHVAQPVMARTGTAILTEGYFDALACHAAGIESAVATMGTALSIDHVKRLARWCQKAVIVFDGDKAGQEAAAKATSLLEAEGIEVRIAALPAGEDPDTILRSQGTGALKAMIKGAETVVGYRVRRAEQSAALSETDRWEKIAKAIAAAPTPLERRKWIEEMAPRYTAIKNPDAAARALERMVARHATTRERRPVREPAPQTGLIMMEVALIQAVINEVTRDGAHETLRNPDLMETAEARTVATAYSEAFLTPPVGRLSRWIHEIQDEEAKSIIMTVAEMERLPLAALEGACNCTGLRNRAQTGIKQATRVTDEFD